MVGGPYDGGLRLSLPCSVGDTYVSCPVTIYSTYQLTFACPHSGGAVHLGLILSDGSGRHCSTGIATVSLYIFYVLCNCFMYKLVWLIDIFDDVSVYVYVCLLLDFHAPDEEFSRETCWAKQELIPCIPDPVSRTLLLFDVYVSSWCERTCITIRFWKCYWNTWGFLCWWNTV